jgi:hypothetical protein
LAKCFCGWSPTWLHHKIGKEKLGTKYAQTKIWWIEVWIKFVPVLLKDKKEKKQGYNILIHMPKIKLFINNYECNLPKLFFQPHRGGIRSWIVFEWELWCIVGNILIRTIKNWAH